MAEAFTEEQYISFLKLAPTNLLEQTGKGLIIAIENIPEESAEAEIVSIMLAMLLKELELRQIEPLWRKAERFAIRNSNTFKEVGKIAACLGAGAILGVSLDN